LSATSEGHEIRILEVISAYKILIGKPEDNRPLGGISMGGKIILKLILKKKDTKMA
jgi:hypothetical protein